MSALPLKIVDALGDGLPFTLPPGELREALEGTMDPALGADRLVVAGPLESELRELVDECVGLRKKLTEVRAQRDEWEQIATGYRHRLLSTGVGLSRITP